MAKRQTIAVATVRDRVNTFLKETPTQDIKGVYTAAEYRSMRVGAASVLETILHETGNYRGFQYLDAPYVRGETDESRREYL